MDPVAIKPKPKYYKQKEPGNVYSPCQITKTIVLPITAIGKNLKPTLENTIAKIIGGKCIVEGYVKPGSISIISYSSGIIKGEKVVFDAVFSCSVCYLVAGMNLNCVAKEVTKAGIRAESADINELNSPFVLYIARDHYYDSSYFNSIKENDKIIARVIAQRFELNDKYISVIAELVMPQKDIRKDTFSKAKLIID